MEYDYTIQDARIMQDGKVYLDCFTNLLILKRKQHRTFKTCGVHFDIVVDNTL